MIERPIRFAQLPTPLHRLERLSESCGADIWIKRDDLTGFAMGGNKVRKAEFLIGEAKRQGANVVLTAGAVQSNHARVIAACAGAAGLPCELVLSGDLPEPPTGNVLLDRLAGARINTVTSSTERAAAIAERVERLRPEGFHPYIIPIGGSNATGAMGYALAFQELAAQLAALPLKSTTLLFASSSGGTYAGLLAGKALTGSDVDLLGIRVDLDPDPENAIVAVASELAERLGLQSRPFRPAEVPLNAEFVGPGYGEPTMETLLAIKLAWKYEGVLLDPVYTGKAMAGLLALAGRGELEGRRAVFLHTGGEPGVFGAGLPHIT